MRNRRESHCAGGHPGEVSIKKERVGEDFPDFSFSAKGKEGTFFRMRVGENLGQEGDSDSRAS